MATGTVKFFNADKGYGFIKQDDDTVDIFVHARAIEQSGLLPLQEGMRVGYDLGSGKSGKPEAINLRLL